ncbi:MAG: hypothetical protein U0487_01030 [Patescibacteria group bacterium]
MKNPQITLLITLFCFLTEGCYQSSFETEVSRFNCENPPPLVPAAAFTDWGIWTDGHAVVEHNLVTGMAGTCNNLLVGISEPTVPLGVFMDSPNETLTLSIHPGADTRSTSTVTQPFSVEVVNAPFGYVVQSPDLDRGLQVIKLYDHNSDPITSLDVPDSHFGNSSVDYDHFVIETTDLPLLVEVQREPRTTSRFATKTILPSGELGESGAVTIETTTWWWLGAVVANDEWMIFAENSRDYTQNSFQLSITFAKRDGSEDLRAWSFETVPFFGDSVLMDTSPHDEGVLLVMNDSGGGLAFLLHPDGTRAFITRLPGAGSTIARTPYGFVASSYDETNVYVTIVDTVTTNATPQTVTIDAFPENSMAHHPQLGIGYYGYRIGVSATWFDLESETVKMQYHIVGAQTP